MTSPCRAHRLQSTCAIERYERRIDRDGAALQRFATDTTCNDTRHEPHELLSSVDKALAIAAIWERNTGASPAAAARPKPSLPSSWPCWSSSGK